MKRWFRRWWAVFVTPMPATVRLYSALCSVACGFLVLAGVAFLWAFQVLASGKSLDDPQVVHFFASAAVAVVVVPVALALASAVAASLWGYRPRR